MKRPVKPSGTTGALVSWIEKPWPVAEKWAVIPPAVWSIGSELCSGALLKSKSTVWAEAERPKAAMVARNANLRRAIFMTGAPDGLECSVGTAAAPAAPCLVVLDGLLVRSGSGLVVGAHPAVGGQPPHLSNPTVPSKESQLPGWVVESVPSDQ